MRRLRTYRRPFDFAPTRRREIERYAKHVGAAQTDDFPRFLIAWSWHNPKSTDPVWALMNGANRMGGKITETEASAILEEASITRRYMAADDLGRFLGLPYSIREQLGIRTIGARNVPKRARKELRKRHDRLAKERKRRATGVRPRAEYEANSMAAKARAEGVSRMTIYRRIRVAEQARNSLNVTGVSAAIFLSSEDGPVTPAGVKGPSERRCRAEEKKEDFRLATATTLVADLYATLPLELRMAALCLPMLEKLARAA
jgi:hypothetical protein